MAVNVSERPVFIHLAISVMVVVELLTGCSQSFAQPNTSTQNMFVGVTARPPDAFYDPPPDVPNRPGVLLRTEPLKDVALPERTRAWRILYTTAVDDKVPVTAAATVFAPSKLPAGPLPVIAWAHGTAGLLQKCMPSLVSAPTLGIPAVDQVLKAGWVVVATDYSFAEKDGPQPYIIGQAEARAVLDSVRAARQMPELKLDSRAVVWGHSQGGHAALWTGIIGSGYAPDVQLAGVVGIAPPGDMLNLLSKSEPLDRRLGPYIAVAYSRFYPDVMFDQAVRPEAQTAAREIAGLCTFIPREDSKRVAALLKTFEGPVLTTSSNAALYARLKQNTANQRIAAPLLIAQGLSDSVVLPAATDIYVAKLCASGQKLEYWTFKGRDHSAIVQPGTPLDERLVAWTKARFANEPQASGCTRATY
jgi:pimeloyl-ACP methyl ester carboxylesterase